MQSHLTSRHQVVETKTSPAVSFSPTRGVTMSTPFSRAAFKASSGGSFQSWCAMLNVAQCTGNMRLPRRSTCANTACSAVM